MTLKMDLEKTIINCATQKDNDLSLEKKYEIIRSQIEEFELVQIVKADTQQNTLLHLLVKHLPEVIPYFPKEEIIPLIRRANVDGATPIHFAAQYKRPLALAILCQLAEEDRIKIETVFQLEDKQEKSASLVDSKSDSNTEKFVKCVDMVTKKSESALHMAVKSGSLECIAILLFNKCKLKTKNKDGKSASELKSTASILFAFENPLEWIIKSSELSEKNKCHIIEDAFRDNRNKNLFFKTDHKGNTALIFAVIQRLPKLVALLLKISKSWDEYSEEHSEESSEESPERYSAEFFINAQNTDGNTATHFAAMLTESSSLLTLCKNPNININVVNKLNQTAIHRAIMVAASLLQNSKTNTMTATKDVALRQSISCVAFLAKQPQINISIKSKNDGTPLEMVESIQNEAHQKILLDALKNTYFGNVCEMYKDEVFQKDKIFMDPDGIEALSKEFSLLGIKIPIAGTTVPIKAHSSEPKVMSLWQDLQKSIVDKETIEDSFMLCDQQLSSTSSSSNSSNAIQRRQSTSGTSSTTNTPTNMKSASSSTNTANTTSTSSTTQVTASSILTQNSFYEGDLSVFKYYFEHKGDPNQKIEGKSPFYHAFIYKKKNIFKIFFEEGALISGEDIDDFNKAIKKEGPGLEHARFIFDLEQELYSFVHSYTDYYDFIIDLHVKSIEENLAKVGLGEEFKIGYLPVVNNDNDPCIKALYEICSSDKEQGKISFDNVYIKKCVFGLLEQYTPNEIFEALNTLTPQLSKIKKSICICIFKEILVASAAWGYTLNFGNKLKYFSDNFIDTKDDIINMYHAVCNKIRICKNYKKLTDLIYFNPIYFCFKQSRSITDYLSAAIRDDNFYKNIHKTSKYLSDELKVVMTQFFQTCDLMEFKGTYWEVRKTALSYSPHIVHLKEMTNGIYVLVYNLIDEISSSQDKTDDKSSRHGKIDEKSSRQGKIDEKSPRQGKVDEKSPRQDKVDEKRVIKDKAKMFTLFVYTAQKCLSTTENSVIDINTLEQIRIVLSFYLQKHPEIVPYLRKKTKKMYEQLHELTRESGHHEKIRNLTQSFPSHLLFPYIGLVLNTKVNMKQSKPDPWDLGMFYYSLYYKKHTSSALFRMGDSDLIYRCAKIQLLDKAAKAKSAKEKTEKEKMAKEKLAQSQTTSISTISLTDTLLDKTSPRESTNESPTRVRQSRYYSHIIGSSRKPIERHGHMLKDAHEQPKTRKRKSSTMLPSPRLDSQNVMTSSSTRKENDNAQTPSPQPQEAGVNKTRTSSNSKRGKKPRVQPRKHASMDGRQPQSKTSVSPDLRNLSSDRSHIRTSSQPVSVNENESTGQPLIRTSSSSSQSKGITQFITQIDNDHELQGADASNTSFATFTIQYDSQKSRKSKTVPVDNQSEQSDIQDQVTQSRSDPTIAMIGLRKASNQQ